MRFVGVDLHKRVVVVCVVELQCGKRVVVARGRWTLPGYGRADGVPRGARTV
jgi:hypothetical protein